MTRPRPTVHTIKQHGRAAWLVLVLGLVACQAPAAPLPTATPRPSPAKVRFGLLPSGGTATVARLNWKPTTPVNRMIAV